MAANHVVVTAAAKHAIIPCPPHDVVTLFAPNQVAPAVGASSVSIEKKFCDGKASPNPGSQAQGTVLR